MELDTSIMTEEDCNYKGSVAEEVKSYHIFVLDGEMARVVIKAVPQYMTEEEVNEAMQENNIRTIKVTRIIRTVKTARRLTQKIPISMMVNSTRVDSTKRKEP